MWIIKNLNYKIDQFHLSIPELSSQTNQIVAVMGPSGAGKTTLFKILTGQISVSGWSWIVNGVDLAPLAVADRKLGLVMQSFDLFPHLSVQENIEIVMQSRQVKGQDAIQLMNRYRQILKLDRCWNLSAEKISGGERQRVSLLRALVSNPSVILLDEPFSALDQESRQEARELVLSALKVTQVPVIVITHDPEDCRALGAFKVQLDNGRIQF